MVANRYSGVRAALYYGGPKDILVLSKEHNNANALALGARFIPKESIVESVLLWLGARFSEDERHIRRIAKIDAPSV